MDSKRSWFLSSVCIGLCVLQVAVAKRIAKTKCEEYIEKASDYSLGGDLSFHPEVLVFSSANCNTSIDLIVGGDYALVGEFPHQAVLGYPKKNALDQIEFKCGGSLISEWYVLTVAHCQRDHRSVHLKPTIVRLGEHDLENDGDGQQDFKVADFIYHPNYTSSYVYHDIALVLLTQEVQFNERIRPACLWTNTLFNMSTAVASGFGRTSKESKLMSTKLMKVKLEMLDIAKCEKKFPFDRKLSKGLIDEQICVGSQENGKDTCEGDSGGPLQVAFDVDSCVYHIVGLTSFGRPDCGVGNSMAVYTQVASYLDWIEQVVWGEEV